MLKGLSHQSFLDCLLYFLFCSPLIFIFHELKSPGGRPMPLPFTNILSWLQASHIQNKQRKISDHDIKYIILTEQFFFFSPNYVDLLSVCLFFLLIPLLRAKSSTSQRWLLCTSRIRLNLLWMSVRTSTPPSWTASLRYARRRHGCCSKAKPWLPELVINATLQLHGDSLAFCCPPRWLGWKAARRKDGSQPVRGSKVYWNPWRTTNQRKTNECFRIEAVFLYLWLIFLSLLQ